ncbi:hypothetical protein C2E23DRAFT_845377 [Lenzites betulinus]|nr:hypothetical protein C2E23DRAFT_845357 [Lenzites betulinus]KAH9848113.1 hypothetical protein C2E23DRAFT_845377 [Lenzites betulinus]
MQCRQRTLPSLPCTPRRPFHMCTSPSPLLGSQIGRAPRSKPLRRVAALDFSNLRQTALAWRDNAPAALAISTSTFQYLGAYTLQVSGRSAQISFALISAISWAQTQNPSTPVEFRRERSKSVDRLFRTSSRVRSEDRRLRIGFASPGLTALAEASGALFARIYVMDVHEIISRPASDAHPGALAFRTHTAMLSRADGTCPVTLAALRKSPSRCDAAAPPGQGHNGRATAAL